MVKAAFVAAGLLAASVAQAQYYTGFEATPYSASAGGTVLTGQNGWYLPSGIDDKVYTYTGNSLGFVQNPVGGDQFIAGVSGGGTSFARAQHNVPFGSAQYTVSYDMAAAFSGTAPSAANLSSFSLNHDTLTAGQFRGFINLNNFIDLTNPAAGWKAEFNVFNAAGTAMTNQSPGAAWTNLLDNHWYRQYITFNLSTNLISSITLVDLHSGASSNATPTGWYLDGGATSTLPLPDAVRFFVGGNAGNTMGWDNVSVVPAPASLALLGLGGLIAGRRRRA
jgi:hypothetical protein